MSVTVDFLFKASKDGSFNSVIKQVTGGIGKLTDEAEKASENVEKLMAGKFKNAPLNNIIPNLAEAINTGDIEKVNAALLEMDRILTTLESKLNKQALKHLGDITPNEMSHIAESALKTGSKKGTISKMVLDRASKRLGKDVSFDIDSLLEKSDEEVEQRLNKLAKKQVLNGTNINEIKEYIALYQRMIDIGKEVPDIVQQDINTINEMFEDGIFRDFNDKALFNYDDLMDQVSEASQKLKEQGKKQKEKKESKQAAKEEKEAEKSIEQKAKAEEKVTKATEESAKASEKEKEAKEETVNKTEEQSQKQDEVAKKTKESANNAEKEKEAKKETSEATQEQASKQDEVTEKTKKSADNVEKEKEAKNEVTEKTEKQAQEQEKVAEKTKESEDAAKKENEAKQESKEATEKQASAQEKVTDESQKSAKAAQDEADAQRDAAKAVEEKNKAEEKSADTSKKKVKLTKEQRAQIDKNLGHLESRLADTMVSIEKIEEALSGKNIVQPKNLDEARNALQFRKNKLDQYGKYKSEKDKKYPDYGFRKIFSYYRQLEANRDLDRKNQKAIDAYMGKAFIPDFADGKMAGQAGQILAKMLAQKKEEEKNLTSTIANLKEQLGIKEEMVETEDKQKKAEQETAKLIEQKTKQKKDEAKASDDAAKSSEEQAKSEQKAGDMLAKIKKKKDAEKKALEQQKKEEEKKRKAEERAEKKAEQQMKLNDAKAKSKQDARQKELDNYAKWTGFKVNDTSKQAAIEQNEQLSNSQEKVTESAEKMEQAEISATEAIKEVTGYVYGGRMTKYAEEDPDYLGKKVKDMMEGLMHKRPTLLDDLIIKSKELSSELKPIDEMAQRISKNSSIKNISSEDIAKEAARLNEIIGDPKNAEERYTAIVKMDKLIEKYANEAGGVKGSGAKSKSELRSWIFNNWARDTGADFTKTIDAMFGNDESSLYYMLGNKTTKRSMRELGAMALGKDPFWDNDRVRSDLETVDDAIEYVNRFMSIEQKVEDVVNNNQTQAKTPVDISNIEARANELANETQAMSSITDSFESLKNALPDRKQPVDISAIQAKAEETAETINAMDEITDSFSSLLIKNTRIAPNGRLALPEISSETARKSALQKGNKEAWDKATEEYNRDMEKYFEEQAKDLQRQAQEMREAQIKAVENAYRKLTGNGRSTTYAVNKSKDTRTALQNQQVDRYKTDAENAEKLYEESAKIFAKDQAAMERINAARQSWFDAMAKGAEYVQQSQEQADAKTAEKAAEKAEQTAQQEAEKAAKQQQRRKNKSSKAISGRQIKEAEKYVESVKDANLTGDNEKINTFYAQINAIKEALNSIKSVDLIDNDDTEQVTLLREQTEALAKALERAKETGKDVIDVSSTEKALDMQEKIGQLMQNANLSNDQYLQLSRYNEALKSGNVNAAEYDRIASGFSKINAEVSKGSTLVDAIQHKFKNLAGYLVSFMSFYRIIGTVKEMANTVREFDDAFTEMRKVSDESVETLKAYQKESYDLAASVGTDALSLQKSTADYMRLGESLEEAKKSAQAANILMNVSEFKGIDEATESLIAMSAAYKDLDKMTIVDKLNKIGNDFAISTDGIATALKDSAAALTTAGNSIDESVALVTAANQTLQSPATAGKAIRTISLRLTGTKEAKKELEEEGEEVESFVETQSKLRETIRNATKTKSNNFMGFDILNDKGAYKSTYEIMLGIAKLYDEIVENDKKTGAKNMNLLLETLAGKNRAAAAASILQNATLLEDVYNESAFESANSAIIENEKYLDSLSGKLAQLKTAWQELQTTIMDSSFLKGLTDFGTGALKGATGTMNELSPTSLLMTMAGGFMGLNGIGPVSFDRNGKMKSWFKGTGKDTTKFIQRLQEQATAQMGDPLETWGVGMVEFTEEIPDNINKIKLSALDLDKAMDGLNISDNDREIVQGLKEQGVSLGDMTDKLKNNQTAWSQLKQVAVGTLASMGVSFGVSLGVDFFQKLTDAPNSIAEAASAMGNTIKEETKSINDYKQKVQELWDIINDPKATIEDQANARQELLNIQNELIANYGSEAALLTGVSASADAAANSFDRLAEAQYKANMIAFNEGEGNGTIKNIAQQMDNAINGYEDNIDRMVSNMENQSITGLISKDILKENEDFGKELQKIYERNNLEISRDAGDGGFTEKISGSARDMKKALEEAKVSLEDFKYTMSWNDYDNASKSINDYINSIDRVIAKNGDLYDQRNLYENILNNEDMKKHYDNLKQYYEDYKQAFASGDSEAIGNAIKVFTVEFDNAIAQAGEGSGVASYFENMYSTMQKVMGEYNFTKDFEKNIGGIKDSVQGYLDALKGMSTEELANFTITRNTSEEAADGWKGLEQLANDYGMTIQELIPKLEEMGLVQSNAFKELVSHFNGYEDLIANYSQEELQIAYRVYADGMTFDELDDAVQRERKIEIGFDIHDRSGLEEYNNITSSQKSKHADYDQYRQMMEDAQKLREEGRIGEEQFKQAAKLFSENGMTDYKNWDENYKALKKYFTEGSAGAETFTKDIVALGKEFATVNDDGGINLNLDNMDDLAEKLHMPMEMLQVLLENLQSFGATDDYFGNIKDGAEHLTELYKQLTEEQSKYDQMVKDGVTGTALEEQDTLIKQLKESIETTKSGIGNLVDDIKNYKDESSAVYQANKDALQELIEEYNALDETELGDSYSYVKKSLEEAIGSLSDEYGIPVKIEGDTASIDDSIKLVKQRIEDAQNKLRELKKAGGGKLDMNDEEVQKTIQDLQQAIDEKQKLEEPAIMKINASDYDVDVEVQEAINKLQEFQRAYSNLESLQQQKALGIPVDDSQIEEAEGKVNELASELGQLDGTTAKIGIDTSSGDAASIKANMDNASLDNVKQNLSGLQATAKVDADTSSANAKIDATSKKLSALNQKTARPKAIITVNGLAELRNANSYMDNMASKGNITRTVNIVTKKTNSSGSAPAGGGGHLYGTAHAKGTAYATHGDWGAEKDETALVGELGSELRVRGSHWDLLGENGTEFANIRKGDINNIVSSYSDVCVKII